MEETLSNVEFRKRNGEKKLTKKMKKKNSHPYNNKIVFKDFRFV
jgi:hypothetical protein